MVDDVADLREEIAEALRSSGYEVHTFADGLDALHGIDTAPDVPDVVLLDVVLPYMSGLEVLRRLREHPRTATVPVLLLTGFDLTDEQLLEAGDTTVLRKPLMLDEFMGRIRKLTQGSP